MSNAAKAKIIGETAGGNSSENKAESEALKAQNSQTQNSQIFKDVDSLLREGIKRHNYSAASLALYQRGACSYLGVVGDSSEESGCQKLEGSLFDTGELTGALITTTLVVALASAGHLNLDEKVCKYVEGFGILGKEKIRIRNLLAHTSGLRDSGQLLTVLMEDACVSRVTTKLKVLNQINSLVPETNRVEYASLNYVILGYLVEQILGDNLGEIFEKFIARPLGLRSSYMKVAGTTDVAHGRYGFKEPKRLSRETFVSSGVCHKRGEIKGDPFDYLTHKLGGVSGAGGYFASSGDIARILQEYQLGLAKKSSLLASSVLYDMMGFPSVAQKKPALMLSSCLGWGPSAKVGYMGNLIDRLALSKFSFAMQSSTGCFAAIDPERQIQIVFLSNGLGTFAWPKPNVCPVNNRKNLRRLLRLDPKWRMLEIRHDPRKFKFVQDLVSVLIASTAKRGGS